jgi:tRNA (guanine37-N1)-methyltransferase
MRIDVVTIFPELFETFARTSLLGAACAEGRVALSAHDLRAFANDRHRTVDDVPYGGGPGMVMKPEPLVAAIESLAGAKGPSRTAKVILLSPQGVPLRQRRAAALAQEAHLVLVCGRYEGVDHRVSEVAVDLELTIGDYVLAGGEVPAMAVIEAVVRLLPGVLGNPASVETESFGTASLEGPQYTRPAVFRGLEVPAVLRSGHHAEIARWREQQALEFTRRRRPDLLDEREERE